MAVRVIVTIETCELRLDPAYVRSPAPDTGDTGDVRPGGTVDCSGTWVTQVST